MGEHRAGKRRRDRRKAPRARLGDETHGRGARISNGGHRRHNHGSRASSHGPALQPVATRPQQLRPRAGGVRARAKRLPQRERRPGEQLGILVQQQCVSPPCASHQLGVIQRLAAPLVVRDHLIHRGMCARRLRGPVARAVVEHQHLSGERQHRSLARDRVQAAQQQLPLGGVDHAEAQLDLVAHPPIVSGGARPRRRPLGLHAAV